MKKLFFLMLICVMLLCVSCSDKYISEDNKMNTTNGKNTNSTKVPTTSDILITSYIDSFKIDNITSRYNLITRSYSLNELKILIYNTRPLDSYHMNIIEINKKLKIECLRKNTKNNYYIVYKVKEGGFLYVFLRVGPYVDIEWNPQKPNDVDLYLSHTYYFKSLLNDSDFSMLKSNVSFNHIIKIDPMISELKNYSINTLDIKGILYTIHITNKKIYAITYFNASSKEQIIISKIIEIKSSDKMIINYDTLEFEYNYRLLDVDKDA